MVTAVLALSVAGCVALPPPKTPLSEPVLLQVANAHVDEVGKCFAERPQQVVLDVFVEPDGKATSTGLWPKDGVACVDGAVRAWVYPTASGGSSVRYTFHFEPTAVRIVVSRVQLGGSLAKEAIRQAIRPHLGEVRVCYEQGLGRRRELHGRMRTQFTIAPDGRVEEAHVVDTTLGDDEVAGCIVNRLREWRFPPPQGGGKVIVLYPWVLRPAEGASAGAAPPERERAPFGGEY